MTGRVGGRWVVGLGILWSLLLVGWAVGRLDLALVARALDAAVLWPWLPLAVASYLAGHLVRGMRCRRLVSGEAYLSLPAATNVVLVGYAVNNLLPARLGEVARAGVLAERTGLPFVQTLTVTFLERLLDGLVILLLLALTLYAVPGHGFAAALLPLAGLLFASGAAAVALAVLSPGWLLSLASRAANRIAPSLHDRLVGLVAAVTSGVAYLRQPRRALAVAGLSLLVWLLESGLFLALLEAFDIDPLPSTALLAMTVTNLGILLPSSPGFIGPFHFFCMSAVASTGVPAELALAYAVLVHLAFYVPVTVWGVAALAGYGLSLARTRELVGRARPIADLPAEIGASGRRLSHGRPLPAVVPSSRFLLALTEALVPAASGDGAAAAPGRVAAVAEFVAAQLRELPLRLQLLFAVGMGGFRVLTWVRHGRTFCALPLARRRPWVEAWAYGRLGLARQLFRPVRSLALLAYFEPPMAGAGPA